MQMPKQHCDLLYQKEESGGGGGALHTQTHTRTHTPPPHPWHVQLPMPLRSGGGHPPQERRSALSIDPLSFQSRNFF